VIDQSQEFLRAGGNGSSADAPVLTEMPSGVRLGLLNGHHPSPIATKQNTKMPSPSI